MAEMIWTYLYIVYRIDHWRLETAKTVAELSGCVTIKEALPTGEEAEREVERLNELTAEKECSYYYQSARFYPDGRPASEDDHMT